MVTFTEEQEKEIIEYYLAPHTMIQTQKYFNFKSNHLILRTLSKYNIALHSKELTKQLTLERCKATCLEKYGTENVAQSDAVKAKMQETCIKHFGCPYALSSEGVKKKRKQTNLKKYGVENISQLPETKAKVKQTYEEHWGGIGFASTELSTIYRQTCLEKYGTALPQGIEEVIEKRKQQNIVKYGVPYYTQTKLYHKNKISHYYVEDTSFDSLPELAVWIYCRDHNIKIIRLPTSFEYSFNGKIHRYFPDFEIDGQLVEIKGDCFFADDGTMCNPFNPEDSGRSEAKHQCGIQNGVVFWTSKEYSKMLAYFKENYDRNNFIRRKAIQ